MSKGIKPGDFVEIHNDSSEIFKVLSVDTKHAVLIDAENKHKGTYPFDELKKVTRVKMIHIWRRNLHPEYFTIDKK